MGKTGQGAVGLTEERLPAFDYWQFWRNTEDGDVGRFLRLFTELPLDEIGRLAALAGSELNEAKKILATEATALCHGRAAAEAAAATARSVFEEGGIGGELPIVELTREVLAKGLPAFEAFPRAGLAGSNSESRRPIKGGGGRLNRARLASEAQPVVLA